MAFVTTSPRTGSAGISRQCHAAAPARERAALRGRPATRRARGASIRWSRRNHRGDKPLVLAAGLTSAVVRSADRPRLHPTRLGAGSRFFVRGGRLLRTLFVPSVDSAGTALRLYFVHGVRAPW